MMNFLNCYVAIISHFCKFDKTKNIKHHEKNNRYHHDYNRWRNAGTWWS